MGFSVADREAPIREATVITRAENDALGHGRRPLAMEWGDERP